MRKFKVSVPTTVWVFMTIVGEDKEDAIKRAREADFSIKGYRDGVVAPAILGFAANFGEMDWSLAEATEEK